MQLLQKSLGFTLLLFSFTSYSQEQIPANLSSSFSYHWWDYKYEDKKSDYVSEGTVLFLLDEPRGNYTGGIGHYRDGTAVFDFGPVDRLKLRQYHLNLAGGKPNSIAWSLNKGESSYDEMYTVKKMRMPWNDGTVTYEVEEWIIENENYRITFSPAIGEFRRN